MTEIHIKFSTVREDFSEYEIGNGLLFLRVKAVVTDMVKNTENNKTGIGVTFEVFSKIIKRVGNDNTVDHGVTNVRELQFIPSKEVVNIYETDKMIVLVIHRIEKVSSTNQKNEKDDTPILALESNTLVNVVEKPVS